MSKNLLFYVMTTLQMGSTMCLIRMGLEVQDIGKGAWTHAVYKAHVGVLAASLIVLAAGILFVRSYR